MNVDVEDLVEACGVGEGRSRSRGGTGTGALNWYQSQCYLILDEACTLSGLILIDDSSFEAPEGAKPGQQI